MRPRERERQIERGKKNRQREYVCVRRETERETSDST